MATTTCNIRMDENLKAQFDSVAARIGMPTSTAFNVFAKQFVAHGGFPFEVVAPVPTEEEFAFEMERRYAEVAAGLGSAHELAEE